MNLPTRLNGWLAAAHLTINAYQFWVLPLALIPQNAWWALTLVPLGLMNNPSWSLIHETIHGTFHPSRGLNRLAGRFLSAGFGSPWQVLRTGHLLHHQLNRSAHDRPETYDPSQTSRWIAGSAYYFRLLIGLYLSQVLSPLALYGPKRWLEAARSHFLSNDSYSGRAASLLLRDSTLREIRLDGAIIIMILTTSAFCYGAYWWILVAVLAFRGFCISFLDYVYHYGAPFDDHRQGFNLYMPGPFARLLLNFNLHGIHHWNPTLSWVELPDAFTRQGGTFQDHYVSAALRQLQGPIPLIGGDN